VLLYYSEFIPLIQPFSLTFVALPNFEGNDVHPRKTGVSLAVNAPRDTLIPRPRVITETLVYDFIVKFKTLLSNYITIETRQVRYPYRAKVNACYKLQRDGATKFVRTDDHGGCGLESAREALACHDCFVKMTKPT
jgi:hypothetical protein